MTSRRVELARCVETGLVREKLRKPLDLHTAFRGVESKLPFPSSLKREPLLAQFELKLTPASLPLPLSNCHPPQAKRRQVREGARDAHTFTAKKLLNAQLRQAAIKEVSSRSAGKKRADTNKQFDPDEDDGGLGENTVYFDDLEEAGEDSRGVGSSNDRGHQSTSNRRDQDLDGDDDAWMDEAEFTRSRTRKSQSESRNSRSISPTKKPAKKNDYHRDPYALPEMEQDFSQLTKTNGRKTKRSNPGGRGYRTDIRFATETEQRELMSQLKPSDLDTQSSFFQSLPPELQYELLGDMRSQSRGTSYKRLQSMLSSAPTPIDFSKAQVEGLKTRNTLTQKVLSVSDDIGDNQIQKIGSTRVSGERNREYVLIKNDENSIGYSLGVRDQGMSKEKAIVVGNDSDEDDLANRRRKNDGSGSEDGTEFEQVDINSATHSTRNTFGDDSDSDGGGLNQSQIDQARKEGRMIADDPEKRMEILRKMRGENLERLRKEQEVKGMAGRRRRSLSKSIPINQHSGASLFLSDKAGGSSSNNAIQLGDSDDEDDDLLERGIGAAGGLGGLTEDELLDDDEDLDIAWENAASLLNNSRNQDQGFAAEDFEDESLPPLQATNRDEDDDLMEVGEINDLNQALELSRNESLAKKQVIGFEEDDEDMEMEEVETGDLILTEDEKKSFALAAYEAALSALSKSNPSPSKLNSSSNSNEHTSKSSFQKRATHPDSGPALGFRYQDRTGEPVRLDTSGWRKEREKREREEREEMERELERESAASRAAKKTEDRSREQKKDREVRLSQSKGEDRRFLGISDPRPEIRNLDDDEKMEMDEVQVGEDREPSPDIFISNQGEEEDSKAIYQKCMASSTSVAEREKSSLASRQAEHGLAESASTSKSPSKFSPKSPSKSPSKSHPNSQAEFSSLPFSQCSARSPSKVIPPSDYPTSSPPPDESVVGHDSLLSKETYILSASQLGSRRNAGAGAKAKIQYVDDDVSLEDGAEQMEPLAEVKPSKADNVAKEAAGVGKGDELGEEMKASTAEASKEVSRPRELFQGANPEVLEKEMTGIEETKGSKDPEKEKEEAPIAQPALDNISSKEAEITKPSSDNKRVRMISPTSRRKPNVQYDSDSGTPFSDSDEDDEASVPLGPDGFPLPTAEELAAMEAEDLEELGGSTGDFASFLSKSRSVGLNEAREEIEREVAALKAEHATSVRSEEDITRQMAAEVQTMLRLFGIPFITAPAEAEAQCAELGILKLVDGIITDDSDVFLFGGNRVYKNMFNQNKVVECFVLSDLQRELGIDREKLVQLAYLLGSDYTEGLTGVGPVLAMEILALFDGQDGLVNFRDWWVKVQSASDSTEDTRGKTMKKIKKTLRNKVHLEDNWPEPEVLDAYYEPQVDKSEEPFTWGLPDLDGLRTVLKAFLGWDQEKTDHHLLPVIEAQRRRSKKKQTTLDRNGYFDRSGGLGSYAGRQAPKFKSNRLQEVVKVFRSKNGRDKKSSTSKPSTSRKPKPKKAAAKKSKQAGEDDDLISASDQENENGDDKSSDGLEVIDEATLGRDQGFKRPTVRRDGGQPGTQANLDQNIEALEGKSLSKRKRPTPKKAAKKAAENGKGKKKAAGKGKMETDESEEDELESPTDEDEDEAEFRTKASKTRGRGEAARSRGRGTRGRGRGGPSSSPARSSNKKRLAEARKYNLDDVMDAEVNLGGGGTASRLKPRPKPRAAARGEKESEERGEDDEE